MLIDYTESDWKVLTSELNRKSSETLQDWVSKHSDGRITDRELLIAIRTIYRSVSGLCDPQIMRLIETIEAELLAAMKAKK